MHPHDTTNDIPYGYCHCGCGNLTPIAKKTRSECGWVKGQPIHFIHGHHARLQWKTALDRFWEKVERCGEEECWLWNGRTNNQGYGMFWADKSTLVHRFSWELHHGPIPEGMFVCHHCDNPPCVNPAHLFLGTLQDNHADMMAKGRHFSPGTPGELHPNHKLNEDQVRLIRQCFSQGDTRSDLARRYAVSWTNIDDIVRYKSWRHI